MGKYLTLIGLMLLSVVSCTREGDNKPYVPLNPDLKRNYSFKIGSYWIYRDSLSGREDSFYLKEFQYLKSADEGNSNCEKINVSIYEYPALKPSSDSASWLLTLTRGVRLNLEYHYQMKTLESFVINSLNYDYPFANTNYYTFITIIHPTFSANNLIYTNVAECINGQDAYYLKDSIGFVKLKTHYLTENHVWELERYHINY